MLNIFAHDLQMDNYSLEIHAIDSGSPQLTGKTIVHIELLDVNDSPPTFSQSNYTAVVQVGWGVCEGRMQVQATGVGEVGFAKEY